MLNTETTIHPAFQHLGVTTENLDGLIDWYQTVLGMWVVTRTDNPAGAHDGPGSLRVAWLTNDEVNHRMGIIEMPGLSADPDRARHHRLQHVAFAYNSLDDLLGSYLRLKALGIMPVLVTDAGSQTAFYYEDPDRNSIELNTLNYGDHWSAIEHMQNSPDFKRQSLGMFVDPDKLVDARTAGDSPWSIHKRAWAASSSPKLPMTSPHSSECDRFHQVLRMEMLMLLMTGANGKLGRLIVEELLRRAPQSELAVSVRDPAGAKDLAERGVEVRRGD